MWIHTFSVLILEGAECSASCQCRLFSGENYFWRPIDKGLGGLCSSQGAEKKNIPAHAENRTKSLCASSL
jgi:hypothetical protein